MKYQDHPLASIFPSMESSDITKLADDIKLNGLRMPIILFEGKILDGRHRLLACEIAEVEPIFREHKHGDPRAFVISANLNRRHLSASQRAAIAADFSTPSDGGGEMFHPEPMSVDEAAKEMNVSDRSVQKARRVKEASPAKHKQVKEGKKSVNAALDEIAEKKEPKAPKSGRETWGPRDRKACHAAFGKFVRTVDKAPFWNDIKAHVEAIAKELRK